jgi:hypothetical protein
VRSGQANLRAREREDEFWAALRDYLASHPDVPVPVAALRPGCTADKTPEDSGGADGPVRAAASDLRARPAVDADLSANRAGAAARAQADALRSEHRVVSLLARLMGVRTAETAWRQGAKGEQLVGQELEKLARRGWHVVHAIPVGDRGADIDHFVIGPGGCYTVNTKHHPGRTIWLAENALLVDGHRTDYLRNSRHEATRADLLLTAACGFPVPVMPLLVIVGAERFTVKGQPAGVGVLALSALRRWLKTRPPVHNSDTVTRIHAAACRATTWRPATPG